MGLRIIDRHLKQPPREVSEAERLAGLTAETSHWAAIKGLSNLDIQANFIDNFRRAQARIAPASKMVEMASRIRDSILGSHDACAQSHGQVEVATLIALL